VTDKIIIDDHLLLRLLLEDEPPELRPNGAAVGTTGLWYHRLCRALSDQTVVGSISRRLGHVDETVAADLIEAVIELPDSTELLSFRSLGWPMAELVHGGAADVDTNQPLIASSSEFGVSVRSVPI
jgi:hypothetical protein